MEMKLASLVEPLGRSLHHGWLKSEKPVPWLRQAEKMMPSSPVSTRLSPFSSTPPSSSTVRGGLLPYPSSRDVACMLLMMNNRSNKSAMAGSSKKQPTKITTCFCSPTSHPGSFRCRLHRAAPGKAAQTRPFSSSSALPPIATGTRGATRSSLGAPNPIIAAASCFRRRDRKTSRLSRFCPLNQSGAASCLRGNRSTLISWDCHSSSF